MNDFWTSLEYFSQTISVCIHNILLKLSLFEIEIETSFLVYPSKHLTLLCETMGAIGSQYMKQSIDKTFRTVDSNSMETDDNDDVDDVFKATSTFHQMLPRLLKRLDSLVGSSFNKDNVQVVETLSAVCLQSMLGSFMPIKVFHTFERVLKATNHWTQYRIGRSASRCDSLKSSLKTFYIELFTLLDTVIIFWQQRSTENFHRMYHLRSYTFS